MDIPEFYTNKKELIEILNKIFESFINNKKLKITIKFEIGETLKVNNKKYGVIGIKIEGNKQKVGLDSKFFTIIEKDNFIEVLLPFIIQMLG